MRRRRGTATFPLPSASDWLTRLQPCGENADTILIGAKHARRPGPRPGQLTGSSPARSNNFSNPEVLGNNGIQQWQNLTWQPLHINGGSGVVNQEIRAIPGAY